MKECEVCRGQGYYLTCIYCHQEAPIYCYPGGCERVEKCWKCEGEGYVKDEINDDEEEVE